MKKCFKCGLEKDLSEFYAHPRMADGHLNKCKECTKSDVKARYDANPEKVAEYERKRFQTEHRKSLVKVYGKMHRLRNPEKKKARQTLSNAVRDGLISRGPCDVCGTTVDVQGHHTDYARPLDVRWLCFQHHREAHGQVVKQTHSSPLLTF